MQQDYLVLPGVEIGEGHQVDPFVIIGVLPEDDRPHTRITRIGANARIRSHTVIYSGNEIGDRFTSGHGVLIREDNRLGSNVSVGSGTVIEHHVTIGDGVRIHSQAFIPEYTVLEADCWIGPRVVITNAKYPRSPGVKKNLRGVVVKSGAKIGANATLLPGIVVGRGSLVGAGSVVTRDVHESTVVAGNPARFLKNISDLPYRLPTVEGSKK